MGSGRDKDYRIEMRIAMEFEPAKLIDSDARVVSGISFLFLVSFSADLVLKVVG